MTGARFPSPGTPDLWWIDRTQPTPSGTDSAADLALAETIGAPARRERFLRGRRAVRRILASYLDLAPDALPIQLTSDGKPALPREFGLAFSVSHCGDWTALAVAASATIGVDAVDHATFAQAGPEAVTLVASARELTDIAASGGDTTVRRRLWSRKEAVGKALGRGLLADLQAIEIGVADAATPRAVRTPGGLLHVVDCPAPANVTAALCVPTPLRAIQLRDDSGIL